jgi:serine protease
MSTHPTPKVTPRGAGVRKALAGALLAALVIGAGVHSATGDPQPERYLVRYEPGTKDLVLASLAPGATIHHEFDAIGVIAVTMLPDQADALAANGNVVSVGEDPIYHPFAQTVPYGIDQVRAREAWDADRDGVVDAGAATGKGIRVCVVDTGIAAHHEDFEGVPIVGGRSFVNEDWADDRQGHGTHVAGTVAAMNNSVGVVGVSPGEVELLIADVFNDAGAGQASSTILAAANWCADQGANIISMSLGGKVPALADGYQLLYDRGVLIVAAAGNDGAPVINYPAGYPSVVSVAATDSNEAVASFSTFNPDVEVAAPGVAVLSTYPFENSMAVSGGPSYMANSIANANPSGTVNGALADGGDCNTAPAPGQFQGKVVLCERGGAPFRQKIDNAAAGGAVAAVIYNNVSGNFNGTYGDPCCSSIPAISLSQEDGRDALGFLGSEVSVNVNLLSTSGYAFLSGTSMATPHASATAAVIWSACPALSNDQVRSHLAATTRDSKAKLLPGRDVFYGYGIVQVKEGVDALFDGVDQYDAATGNADGNNPANVECPVGPANEATGGGFVGSGKAKANFSFDVEGDARSGAGTLSLHDRASGVRIELSQVQSVSQLASDCGPVAAGANAVSISGTGTFNGRFAGFRACVADNGDPGRSNDRFYLECVAECSYDTRAVSPDGLLGGGNIAVRTSGSASPSGSGANVLQLDPVNLSGDLTSSLQLFTVRAYDAAQRPLAGIQVAIRRGDGSLEGTAITDDTGRALLSLSLPLGSVEYQAAAGTLESNTVFSDR